MMMMMMSRSRPGRWRQKQSRCQVDERVGLSDRKVLEQRDQVYEKMSQYLQLKNTIQSLQVHTHTHIISSWFFSHNLLHFGWFLGHFMSFLQIFDHVVLVWFHEVVVSDVTVVCSCRRRALSGWRQMLILAVTSTFRLKCKLPSSSSLLHIWSRLTAGVHATSLGRRNLNPPPALFSFVSEDSSRIFVAVGFGFFVEMTHDEALRFIDRKTSQLTAWVRDHGNISNVC